MSLILYTIHVLDPCQEALLASSVHEKKLCSSITSKSNVLIAHVHPRIADVLTHSLNCLL